MKAIICSNDHHSASMIYSVGRLHLVFILSRFLFNLNYSPPTYSWSWHRPVGQLHCVFFLGLLWIDSTFSPPTSSWPWRHPVTLQLLLFHPKIIPLQTLQRNHFVFVCRYLIISLENIFSVSTNCNRASF